LPGRITVRLNPWALPSLLAAGLTLGLLVYVHVRRPPRPLLPSLSAGLLGSFLFAIGDSVTGFLTRDPLLHQWGMDALYTGALLLGPSIWLLTLRFAEVQGAPFAWGRSRWTLLPVAWALAFWPVVLSNPWHERFVTPRIGGRSDFNLLWYVSAVELHVIAATAVLLHLGVARRSRSESARVQARIMAAALLLPALGNLVYVLPRKPPPFDPTSLGLLGTCVLFLVGIYRRRLFALRPIDFAQLLRQESDAVLLLDRDGRLLERNPASARWLGPGAPSPGDAVLPLLAERLASPEASREALDPAAFESALASEPQPPGGRLFRMLNEDVWVRIQCRPIRSARGRLVCRSVRLRDESELHRALAETAEHASVLQAVFATTEQGILVHVDGEIRLVNPQFHEIWRTPPEGRSARRSGALLELYLPMVRNRESFLASVERVQRDPNTVVHDEVRLSDGRILERTSLPLLRDGRPVGRTWSVRDVTEGRRSEEAMRHAQKLESLGVLAGGIAHDFNNLLVAILGNASLAQAELGPAHPANEYLADVERGAERASELTRQLLAYAGKGTVEVSELDLSRLAREVVELVGVTISKQIELQCGSAPELPAVTGDASQLRQVVMNLVLNAADAIGDQEGSVRVGTELVTLGPEAGQAWMGEGAWRPGRYVALRVSDTGQGMSEAVRMRIFDPFFTTKAAGRGLGLAAALGIVRSHRGWIRVESVPELGSEFTVLLPAGSAPAAPPAAVPAAAPWRSDATVLVVDDDPAVAKVAARTLATVGLRVIVARDGRQALALHREQRGAIALVLLDMNMPGLAGDEVFRALRAERPDLPIVLSSGYPEQEALARLSDAGPLVFVQKPYRTQALLARVREALGS
jgi:signal transduction histidine kinase/CheY-like chemotaxis protein